MLIIIFFFFLKIQSLLTNGLKNALLNYTVDGFDDYNKPTSGRSQLDCESDQSFSVEFAASISTIPSDAFPNCASLREVRIPKTIIKILPL